MTDTAKTAQLTDEQKFRADFLYACAQGGLSVGEAHQRVKQALAVLRGDPEKQAALSAVSEAIAQTGRGLASLGGYGLLTLGLLPPTLAGAVGYATGDAESHLSEADVSVEKDRQLLEAYRTATERAKRQNLLAQKKLQRRARPVRPLI